MQVQLITEDTDRGELVEALGYVNIECKAERRRGHSGVAGARYESLHAFVNELLSLLDEKPLTAEECCS